MTAHATPRSAAEDDAGDRRTPAMSAAQTSTVVVAMPSGAIRDAVLELLGQVPSLRVVGVAGTDLDAVHRIAEARADIVLFAPADVADPRRLINAVTVTALSWSPEMVAFVYEANDARFCAAAGATVLSASAPDFDLARDLVALARIRREDVRRDEWKAR